MLTLVELWRTLKPCGVYIVEDIETSYWGRSEIYGYNFNSNRNSFVKRVLEKVETVNSEFYQGILNPRNKDFNKIMNEVEIVSFAYNCIIFINNTNSLNKKNKLTKF